MSMLRALVLCAALGFGVLAPLRTAYAQNDATTAKPSHSYRVDFTISETDAGKKINARHYSIVLIPGDRREVKIGSKVPVPMLPGSVQFQYMDVGTNIDCRLLEAGDDVSLDVHSDFSNLAPAEEQHSPQPIVRQIRIHGDPLAAIGKTVVVGMVDDPTSTRQFQLEATVNRLK